MCQQYYCWRIKLHEILCWTHCNYLLQKWMEKRSRENVSCTWRLCRLQENHFISYYYWGNWYYILNFAHTNSYKHLKLKLANRFASVFYEHTVVMFLLIYCWIYNHVRILDYEWKYKLRFVRIYFDTQTFDIITKESAVTFEDMLSAIGGTMGLLTGFSIISGVEIIYFATKIIWNILNTNKKLIKWITSM